MPNCFSCSEIFPLYILLSTFQLLQSPHIFINFWVRVPLALSYPLCQPRLQRQTVNPSPRRVCCTPGALLLLLEQCSKTRQTGLHEMVLPAVSPETNQQTKGRGPRGATSGKRGTAQMCTLRLGFKNIPSVASTWESGPCRAE